MAKIYYFLIKNSGYSLDKVPEHWREQVEKMLDQEEEVV